MKEYIYLIVQPSIFYSSDLQKDQVHSRTHHTVHSIEQRAAASSVRPTTASSGQQPAVRSSQLRVTVPTRQQRATQTHQAARVASILIYSLFCILNTWTAAHTTLAIAASSVRPMVAFRRRAL